MCLHTFVHSTSKKIFNESFLTKTSIFYQKFVFTKNQEIETSTLIIKYFKLIANRKATKKKLNTN